MLSDDIVAAVEKQFDGNTSDRVLELLDDYATCDGAREVDRVLRGVLKLSAGELDRVRHYIERAKQDYRDILFWAEYSAEDPRR